VLIIPDTSEWRAADEALLSSTIPKRTAHRSATTEVRRGDQGEKLPIQIAALQLKEILDRLAERIDKRRGGGDTGESIVTPALVQKRRSDRFRWRAELAEVGNGHAEECGSAIQGSHPDGGVVVLCVCWFL